MRLDSEFIRLPLGLDAERLGAEIAKIDEGAWRPHPQGHPGNSALPLVARGGDPDDDDVAGAMAPTPHLAQCEYVQQVLESFGTVIGRSRLMRLEGRSQATLHVDTNYYWAERVRIHVPILTSPEIRFLCGERELHMAAGEAWIFDAWRPHNVLNPTGAQRIHLVADTVGSAAFWKLVSQGHRPFAPTSEAAAPTPVAYRPGVGSELAFERRNVPVVMTPWEQAALTETILGDIPAGAGEAHGALVEILEALGRDWRRAWAVFGEDPDGWSAFERLRVEANARLAPLEDRLALGNGVDAVEIVRQMLLRPALNPMLAPPTAAAPSAARRPSRPTARFSRPLIIVAPPRSGTSLLFETLAQAPGLWTIGGESHQLIEGRPELQPANRGWDSNRLGPVDAEQGVADALHEAFWEQLRDRDGHTPPADATGIRLLEKTPKNALRVPFLTAVFPDALFVHLRRDPRETVASMIEAWRSRNFVTYPDLPGWEGPPWSLLLTPEWRSLSGRPLVEIVAAQWAATERILQADLGRLPAEGVLEVDYGELVADPAAVVARICAFADLEWDRELKAPLPHSVHTLTPPDPEKWRAHEEALAPLLPELHELARRKPASAATAVAPLASVSTASFSELLGEIESSLLVSTYQTGKLVTLRRADGGLNSHFRDMPSPMGIALDGDRLAVGTSMAVVEYRNMPAVAAKLAPAPETHDACFLPRRSHVTGDVRVHDLAYADGELWIVATAFSCLATLDEDYSFVPRWRPRFVTALDASDRCHLNGLCVVDDRPRFVTALGTTDEGGAWRERKADGGVVLDVDSSEIVLAGLSMPHSPRWHRNRLWVLESGQGSLGVVDLDSGTLQTVVELPGFTRGLAFAGSLAFVGLSQVREATTFGGLPLTGRLEERRCGVWVVDIDHGGIVAHLSFEDQVQELFDVALMPGFVFPEVAEADSDATRLSYVVPDAALSS